MGLCITASIMGIMSSNSSYLSPSHGCIKLNKILKIFSVVCGAPNAKAGMMGIFAPINTYIPGTKVQLKKSKIRVGFKKL